MVCARIAAESAPEGDAAALASYDRGIWDLPAAAFDYGNAHAAADDGHKEPGWDDPELDALSAEWRREQQQQRQHAELMGLFEFSDQDSNAHEPGWDDPELDAIAAVWQHQEQQHSDSLSSSSSSDHSSSTSRRFAHERCSAPSP